MPKYLTDRQDRRLSELSSRSERRTRTRRPTDRFPGTDFASVAVPRTKITKLTRTVVVGSDEVTPGSGTAWFYKLDTATGLLTPRLDSDGNHIWKTVYNTTTQEFLPNSTPAETFQTLGGDTLATLGGDTFATLQTIGGGSADLIGPDTPILDVGQDVSGRYKITDRTATVEVEDTRLLKAIMLEDMPAPTFYNLSTEFNSGQASTVDGELMEIAAITKGNPTTVRTSGNHGLSTGDNVRFDIQEGMTELRPWQEHTVNVIDADEFTIPVDSSSYSDFTEGDLAKMLTVTVVYDHGNRGHVPKKHDQVWIQKQATGSFYDLVHPGFHSVLHAQVKETIDDGDKGRITLRDGNFDAIGDYSWIAPTNTRLDFGANVLVVWKRLQPVDDGGDPNYPYTYWIVGYNCDDQTETGA